MPADRRSPAALALWVVGLVSLSALILLGCGADDRGDRTAAERALYQDQAQQQRAQPQAQSAVQASEGDSQRCTVSSTGEQKCWGDDEDGRQSSAGIAAEPAEPVDQHGDSAPTDGCAVEQLGSISGTVTRSGRLSSGDCDAEHTGANRWADVYEFSLAQPRRVTIALRSSEIDPMLALIDAQGRRIELDDDGGENGNAVIVRELDAGRYRLEASQYDEQTGSYELSIRVGSALTSTCLLQHISLPWDRTRTLSHGDCFDPDGDEDYADIYQFALTHATEVTIDMASADFDAVLRLLADSGDQIESDDDDGAGTNARITRRLNAGTYLVVATEGEGGRAAGDYRLQIRAEAEERTAEEEVEEEEIAADEGCVVEQLANVSGTVTRSGRLSSGDCDAEHTGANRWADVYEFSLAQPRRVTIALRSSEIDPMLALIDAQARRIALDDDGGEGRNAQIVRDLNAGRYRVEVSNYDRQAGSYELSIQVGAASRTACSIQDISLPWDRTGTLSSGDCLDPLHDADVADIYRFTLTNARMVTINMVSADFDAYVRLLDDSGEQIERDDNGGDGRNARIVRSLGAGTYRVVATHLGEVPTSESYRLQISADAAGEETAGDCPPVQLGGISGTVERSGRLRSGDCIAEHTGLDRRADVYEFSLAQPRRVRIDLQSSDIDPMLALIDADGRRIERDDNDGIDGKDARIVRELSAGRYRVEASQSDTATGSYDLTILAVAASGDTCSIRDISLPWDRAGTLSPGGCIDPLHQSDIASIYRFTLTDNAEVTIVMISTDFDPFLRLLDGSGSVIKKHAGYGGNARIVQAVNAGTYQVVATHVGRVPRSNSYRLEIRTDVAGNATADACAIEQLGSISGTVERTGRLSSGDCTAEHTGRDQWADLYAFSLARRATVTIELHSTEVDPMLALVDAQGRRIEFDDDGGGGRNALIVRALAAGRYQVEASKYDTPAGSYELRISASESGGLD